MTTPDELVTVATPVAPLLHVPPGVISPSVVVVVAQSAIVPKGAVGKGLTVTVASALPEVPAL